MEDILKYKREDIQKVVDILDSLNVVGVQQASKLVAIYNVLNSFIKEEKENCK